MNNLTASLEDYLEIIYNSIETNNSIKAVEIAKKLNISRASVSEALTKLSDKGLIVYEGHKGITITEEGQKEARKVILKHNTLSAFFENTLGINKEIAELTEQVHVLQNAKANGYIEPASFMERMNEIATRTAKLRKDKKFLLGNDECEQARKKTEQGKI